MTTILIAEEIHITRQEGDTATLRFIVPEVVSLVGRNIRLEVRTRAKELVFRKQGADWTVAGQNISANMLATDTRGYSGKHRWELQVNIAQTEVITIGRGNFTIEPELITAP
jgi:hypothetical protein